MPEKVYDVFRVSHPIHILLAKTMDTEWFEATCIINLREERKNFNMKQAEIEKPHKLLLLFFKGKTKVKK